jgi:hypothetical protein
MINYKAHSGSEVAVAVNLFHRQLLTSGVVLVIVDVMLSIFRVLVLLFIVWPFE